MLTERLLNEVSNFVNAHNLPSSASLSTGRDDQWCQSHQLFCQWCCWHKFFQQCIISHRNMLPKVFKVECFQKNASASKVIQDYCIFFLMVMMNWREMAFKWNFRKGSLSFYLIGGTWINDLEIHEYLFTNIWSTHSWKVALASYMNYIFATWKWKSWGESR